MVGQQRRWMALELWRRGSTRFCLCCLLFHSSLHPLVCLPPKAAACPGRHQPNLPGTSAERCCCDRRHQVKGDLLRRDSFLSQPLPLPLARGGSSNSKSPPRPIRAGDNSRDRSDDGSRLQWQCPADLLLLLPLLLSPRCPSPRR
eukprot:755994-Hanusia_phi.AAC.1